jgi:putative phosphoribosyl transferase
MYFEDRMQAGLILAKDLVDAYRYENCVVVALGDGAVIVGEQIARHLHCLLTMLLIEEVEIPGEGINIGGVSEGGNFCYDSSISPSEIEDYNSEYHGYFDQKKREAFQRINRLLGDGGIIDENMLREHVVILVSDGFNSGSSLDVAVDFLKPIKIQRLVVAAPISTVQAVDKMHILADELHVLDVKQNFLGVNHYYNKNIIPSHEDTIKKINQIILNWR